MSVLRTRIFGVETRITRTGSVVVGRFVSPLGDDVMYLPYDLRSHFVNSEGDMATVLAAMFHTAYALNWDRLTDTEEFRAAALLIGRHKCYTNNYADFCERICSGCGEPIN